MVAQTTVSSWLKIWTMWRSDCESRILKTYVPAGNMAQPWAWTPGVSTGSAKVITVLRFQSSAFTLEEHAAPMSAAQNTVGMVFENFTATPSPDLRIVSGPHMPTEKHSYVRCRLSLFLQQ